MNIAIIGWGSLIWCPGCLRIKTRWRLDGPKLPIEFARISQDERLTLVIHLGSEDQPTYWAVSELTTLDEARRNLQEREGAKLADIHYFTRNGRATPGILPEVITRTRDWLASHSQLDVVMWTGLRSDWKEKRGKDFSIEDAINYLAELEAARNQVSATYNRAREYIRNTPPHVQTPVRRAMRARGWQDAELPIDLFEN
jgi:hypothetical protein